MKILGIVGQIEENVGTFVETPICITVFLFIRILNSKYKYAIPIFESEHRLLIEKCEALTAYFTFMQNHIVLSCWWHRL